jgi:AcrR family transcriptional regulator
MPKSKEQFAEIRKKTRETILSSALKLFAEKGFQGTSMNDIAKAANISKGLAYNYFDGKKKIMEAIFEQLFIEGEKMIEWIEAMDDPFEQIIGIIEGSFKYYEGEEELFKLYMSFVFQPEILEQGKKLAYEFDQKYMGRMELLFSELGFKNPMLEARYLSAVLDGIGMDYFLNPETFPLMDMKKYLLKKYSREEIERMNKL